MTKSSNFLVTILNFEILLNFSVQVVCFTQTNQKTDYNTKFTMLKGSKVYVLNFIFREISPKFDKSLFLIKLNHLKLAYVCCKVITYGYHLSQYLPSKVSHFR